MLVTTADIVPGQRVQILGLVSGNVVTSKHIGRDLMAGFKHRRRRDPVLHRYDGRGSPDRRAADGRGCPADGSRCHCLDAFRQFFGNGRRHRLSGLWHSREVRPVAASELATAITTGKTKRAATTTALFLLLSAKTILSRHRLRIWDCLRYRARQSVLCSSQPLQHPGLPSSTSSTSILP